MHIAGLVDDHRAFASTGKMANLLGVRRRIDRVTRLVFVVGRCVVYLIGFDLSMLDSCQERGVDASGHALQ
jgi:hypothetical protein